MSDNPILISHINDFLFCPVSIYFHNLVGNTERMSYQSHYQINGTHAHRNIDKKKYSTRRAALQGIEVYCERYDLLGKIDVFDEDLGVLTERKKRISRLYDGQIFQVYAQYFALKDMGYTVRRIQIHSMDDNKNYDLALPEDDIEKTLEFESVIERMRDFDPDLFVQTNLAKCSNCIYEPICGSSGLDGVKQ